MQKSPVSNCYPGFFVEKQAPKHQKKHSETSEWQPGNSGNGSEVSERANQCSGKLSEASERANQCRGNGSETSEWLNRKRGLLSEPSEKAEGHHFWQPSTYAIYIVYYFTIVTQPYLSASSPY